jgi:hypothetical protein
MIKQISGPYTISKILNDGALPGIENRADAFVREVEQKHGYMDVYVSSSLLYHRKQQTMDNHD